MKPIEALLMETLPDILNRHAAFDEERNPVLVLTSCKPMATSDIAKVLGQYSVLPATIVEFLSIGEERLSEWQAVREELQRNIGEELGSRTTGQSHYEILNTSARRELGILLSDTVPTSATGDFLDQIRQDLLAQSHSYAAGMLFALEASAIPELTVVAHVINKYAGLAGAVKQPITLSEKNWKDSQDEESEYSLNSFFAAHLFDFEVGHRDRLAEALAENIQSPRELVRFQKGFERVLDLMDQWWDHLAAELCNSDQSSVTCVATWVTNAMSGNSLIEPKLSR